MSKPKKFQKRLEIEILMDQIISLEKNQSISTSNTLQAELITESSKVRGNYNSLIINKTHLDAAKELKNNKSIVIRKADKSNIYVIINSEDYFEKLNKIIHDKNKFIKINKNPIDEIKNKINKVIDHINSINQKDNHLKKIIGDFEPGYLYGNVKNHKSNHPLRPIISQIHTPTYNLAKYLNNLLKSFTPSQYIINSSHEFLQLLKTSKYRN